VKKFGVIEESGKLLYDDITTSYSVNLPADYYLKMIQRAMPSTQNKEDWFIKPHHLETLTGHPGSIKDDFLNTRYYSHYNQSYGKENIPDNKETAIQFIEEHLAELKSREELFAR
jgi:hypothetical protein